MSDFSNGKGIHTYSVQEAVNQHLGKVIRVTPSVLAGATDDNDVMFAAPAEIPNAVSQKGGTSRLIAMTIVDYDAEAHDMDIFFSQKNEVALGTQDGAVDISDVNLSKQGVLGAITVNWGESAVGLIGSSMVTVGPSSTVAGTNTSNQVPLPMLLQAQSDSTSVYFQGIAREAADWAATGNLEFIFHIEYK